MPPPPSAVIATLFHTCERASKRIGAIGPACMASDTANLHFRASIRHLAKFSSVFISRTHALNFLCSPDRVITICADGPIEIGGRTALGKPVRCLLFRVWRSKSYSFAWVCIGRELQTRTDGRGRTDRPRLSDPNY